jgi:hypothetical protein
MYLVSLFGFSFAILSMAEMASMFVAIRLMNFMIWCWLVQGAYIGRTISVGVLNQDREEATLTILQYVD